MDLVLAFKAVVMGVIEGLTEFLPVSSTGHLIASGQLIGFLPGEGNKAFRDLFEVVIQSGAILAVALLYRARILALVVGLTRHDPAALRFTRNLLLAFLPAMVVGWAISRYIEMYLFNVAAVAAALAIGGWIILVVEDHHPAPRERDPEALPWRTALGIGCFQCLAIVFPGASRSASTIMGAMLLGVERTAATNFSFMLAIPTMFAATVYKLFQQRHELMTQRGNLGLLAIGFVVSFIVAWASVAWLLRYIATHTFVAFGWYRMIVGLVLAILLVCGILHLVE